MGRKLGSDENRVGVLPHQICPWFDSQPHKIRQQLTIRFVQGALRDLRPMI